jgi:titin
MSTLTGVTLGYAFDQVVTVRVSATNSYGFGLVSPTSDSSGARIRVVPSQMSPPTLGTGSTDVTVIMNWVALTGTSAGNSAVIAYSLLWDNGVSASAEPTVELVDALVSTFTVTGVTGGTTYRFAVRARNIYGYGPTSTVTVVIPADAPGKTAIPTVALAVADPTYVQVSWTPPNSHSSTITAYDILFQAANG